MSDAALKAAERAVRLALRDGDRTLALRLLSALVPDAQPTKTTKTAAERAAAYRARRRASRDVDVTPPVTEIVTNRHVTRDVTERDAAPSLPSDSSPSKQASEILNFSSLSQTSGSLKQGSDLEEGAGARHETTLFPNEKRTRIVRKRDANASRCVTRDATPEEVSAWCLRWGVPHPDTNPEAAHWLEHHRAKGSRMLDWRACWGTWQRNAAKFAARGVANGKHVQPHDPTAEWAKDGHGGWR